jgi:muramoyltetrapeptide carboxypeptidase
MILAVEDVNENYYRLDRMLRNLVDAGYDRNIRGIICGSFLNCGEKDRATFKFERVVESLKTLTQGPIWLKGRFGHGVRNQRILPLGRKVELSGKTMSYVG